MHIDKFIKCQWQLWHQDVPNPILKLGNQNSLIRFAHIIINQTITH